MILAILYSMDGCPFCVKLKDELKNEIDEGLVVVKGPQDLPKNSNVKGFPHTVNPNNNRNHTGYASKEELFSKLDIDTPNTKEHFCTNCGCDNDYINSYENFHYNDCYDCTVGIAD